MHTTKMKAFRSFVISFAICIKATSFSYASENLNANKQALDMIADFADNFCKEVPLKGTSHSLELSGKAKADLNNLIGKIADLGIEGAGKYQQSKYLGLLQKDLVDGYKSNTNCRLHIWDDLKSKLITSHPDQTKSSVIVEQHSTGDRATNIGNVEGDVNFK